MSKLDNLPRLYGIVEQLYEDLNAYYESFVALPETVDFLVDGDQAVRASAQPQGNLTLVDPHELDQLIARALGPLGRVREKHRHRKHSPHHGLRPFTHRTLSESSKDPQEVPSTDQHPSSTTEPARPPTKQLHGLGRTVRDAINLKVFPSFVSPSPVHPWDVPVLLLDMSHYANDSWDLTLVKVLPYLDGTNHVQRISELADTDVALVCQCVEHLLYYAFAIVIDIFQFSNIYVLRPQVASMFDDVQMGNECASYVARPGHLPLPVPTLFRMYAMLRPGRTLHEWVELAGHYVNSIDVRRFITFGVIKGFVRRVHRYPVLMSYDELVDTGLAHDSSNQPRPSVDLAGSSILSAPPNRSSMFSHLFPGLISSQFSVPDDHETINNQSSCSRARDVRPTVSSRPPTWQGAHRQLATAVDVATVAHDAKTSCFSDPADRRSQRGTTPNSGCRGYLPELLTLLDGSHSDDELCLKFGRSWPDLYALMESMVGTRSARRSPDYPLPPLDTRTHTEGGASATLNSSQSRISQIFTRTRSNQSNLYETTEPTWPSDKRGPKQLAVIAI